MPPYDFVAFWIFDRVVDWVSESPATYAVVAGMAAVDAFFPVVPSETVVISAAALSQHGSLLVPVVFASAALGAFVGDNISYFLGAKVGEPIVDRFFTGEKSKKRLDWAERMLQEHGAAVIIISRFIPGGRTAATFSAGMLELAWTRFLVYDAIAAIVWAAYSTAIGYLGGKAFADSTWKSLVVALGLGAVLAALVEVYRRIQSHRGRDIFGKPSEARD